MYDFTKIKADSKLPHHYLIGVAMHNMKDGPKHRGKMYLKYGPLYFHHSDIENVQNAALMSIDKVFKTTPKEAAEMYDCKSLISGIYGLKLAASANNATIHHFSCDFEIPDAEEWFDNYVKSANDIEYIRSQLDDARMQCY